MVRINKGRPEGQEELFIPSDKFNRSVGNYVDLKFTTTGEPFTGDDAAWEQYLYNNLPNDEDLPELDELLKQDWIQYREWKGNW